MAPIEMPPGAHEAIDEKDESTYVVNQAGYFKYPARHKRDAKPFDLAAYDSFVVCVKLVAADSPERKIICEDTAWPHPLKYLDFSDRNVSVRMSEKKDEILVNAKKPVKGFVFEEKRDWVKFNDNGFDVMPGEEKVVKLGGRELSLSRS